LEEAGSEELQLPLVMLVLLKNVWLHNLSRCKVSTFDYGIIGRSSFNRTYIDTDCPISTSTAMGFTDGAANLRALLTSGGSIEAAMGMLFDDPSGGPQNPHGGGGA